MSINGLKPSNPPVTPGITGVPQENQASKAESTDSKLSALKIVQRKSEKSKTPFKGSEMNPNFRNGALTQYVLPNSNGVS
ncbi:MAG: hypothetical protein K2L24_01770 [Opitutales bacterium]|nr:hypothetical protein [Opitutales bacterium]